MSWGLAFRIRQYVRGSLWLLPAMGVLVGSFLSLALMQVDRSIEVTGILTYSPSTATAVLSTNITAMASLTGFVVTVAVLAVQLATGSFSPRYMRLWYRDLTLKGLLAFLIGTLSYSYTTIRFVEDDFVPNVTVTLAAAAVLVSMVYFVIFFHRVLHRLRPVAVAAQVAAQGARAFEEWIRFIHRNPLVRPEGTLPSGAPALVVGARRAGSIQALDLRGLTAFARRKRCLIVFHHAMGDFVPRDAPLLSVYGDELPPLAGRRLASMVAMGEERTIEQDAMFAVRVMVDVANKALSPAVNDPTTAVQVLDHLAEVLRRTGTAELPDRDDPPGLDYGVLLPLRGWGEILELGVTEIREFGASSLQVVRRLRALLLELEQLVPPGRQAAVREQLRRLDATVERTFGTSEDHDLALVPDAQGIGGPDRPNLEATAVGPAPGL